jgi:hypothetical protein
MLPTIRKIYPALVATDIIKVQPMSGLTGSIFTTNFNKSMVDRTVRLLITKVDLHWNVRVAVNDHSRIDEIFVWLENIPSDQYWTSRNDLWNTLYINFYNEEAVLAFKLVWDNAR